MKCIQSQPNLPVFLCPLNPLSLRPPVTPPCPSLRQTSKITTLNPYRILRHPSSHRQLLRRRLRALQLRSSGGRRPARASPPLSCSCFSRQFVWREFRCALKRVCRFASACTRKRTQSSKRDVIARQVATPSSLFVTFRGLTSNRRRYNILHPFPLRSMRKENYSRRHF